MGKVSTSAEIQKLEEETLFMESELLKLREVVKKQRIKEQSQQKRRHGKSKPNRKGKGKVKDKDKDKDQTPRYRKLRAKDQRREPFVPSKVLRRELAHKWAPKHVSTWLDSLSLSQYKQKFRENDVDGAVLLELGVDDLDYLEIKSLAHRKALLKAVQKLRNARYGNEEQQQLGYVPEPLAGTEEETKMESRDNNANTTSNSPLASALTAEIPESGLPGSVLDEAAEHKSFVEAVEEWRRMQKKSGPAKVATVSGGDVVDETEHFKFKAAVDCWRESSRSVQGKAEIMSYEAYVEETGKDMEKLKARIISDFEKNLALVAPGRPLPNRYTRSDISACY